MSTEIAELPHEVSLHFRTAKAQHRVAEKYKAQALELEAKTTKLVTKMDQAQTAVGLELCAAQDEGIKLGLFPPRTGGRPKAGQLSFKETASNLTGLSDRTIDRYMLEHRDPDKAEVVKQTNSEKSNAVAEATRRMK